MKICKICNSMVMDSAMFCPTCGGSDFILDNENQTVIIGGQPIDNQQQNNIQNNFKVGASVPQYGQVPAYSQPAAQKKKNTEVIIIAIILAAMVFIGIIALIIFGIATTGKDSYNNDYGSNAGVTDDNLIEDPIENMLPFSEGSIVDGSYINEWANIKFTMADEWVDKTAANSYLYDNDYMSCLFNAFDSDISQIVILDFSDSIFFGSNQYIEEKCLDSMFASYKESGSILEQSEKSYCMLGNESYLSGDYMVVVDGVKLVMSAYVRKVDKDNTVILCIMGLDYDKNHQIAQLIESCN